MRKVRLRRRESDRAHKRISYTSIVATLALFLALGGGTAWAAHHYLITSTSQIKPSVRNSLRGHRGYRGYRGYTGKNGTNGTNGAKGATGATGATGAAGAAGAAGATSVTEQIATGTIGTSSSGTGTVNCPTGTKATGGGGSDGGVATAVIYQDGPLPATGTAATPTGWEVSWTTTANAITWSVYAICASP
jgi:hypothetical protein